MPDLQKANLLKVKLVELMKYRTMLSAECVEEFNDLKKQIIELLDDNQRVRFLQIKFFYERNDEEINEQDDLPF